MDKNQKILMVLFQVKQEMLNVSEIKHLLYLIISIIFVSFTFWRQLILKIAKFTPFLIYIHCCIYLMQHEEKTKYIWLRVNQLIHQENVKARSLPLVKGSTFNQLKKSASRVVQRINQQLVSSGHHFVLSRQNTMQMGKPGKFYIDAACS